jgi:gamma-tubulin complex component 2
MLAFVQQIQAFATLEVFEPNWRVLETSLANVTTVDQLLINHVDFLDTCLKGCMLTSSKLLEVRGDRKSRALLQVPIGLTPYRHSPD